MVHFQDIDETLLRPSVALYPSCITDGFVCFSLFFFIYFAWAYLSLDEFDECGTRELDTYGKGKRITPYSLEDGGHKTAAMAPFCIRSRVCSHSRKRKGSGIS